MDIRVQDSSVRLPDDEDRTATFVISTTARDAHGTVLNQKNWDLERYQRNPIVGYQHAVWGGNMCADPNPDMIIGTSTVRQAGRGQTARLEADATFEPREINELAEKVYRKIAFGSMRATSVGFSAEGGKWGEGDESRDGERPTFYFDSQELFEWSVVNMGSNPETVKRDANARAHRALRQAVAGMRALGEDVEVDDVLNMRVSDALKLFDGTRYAQGFREASREEQRQKAVDYVRQAVAADQFQGALRRSAASLLKIPHEIHQG